MKLIDEYRDARSSGRDRRDIVSAALSQKSHALRRINGTLQEASPEAFKEFAHLAAVTPGFDDARRGRFLWAAVTTAKGNCGCGRCVEQYLQSCALWLESQHVLYVDAGIDPAGMISQGEFMSRFFPFDSRFLWVTLELLQSGLRVIGANDGDKWAAQVGLCVRQTYKSESLKQIYPTLDEDAWGILREASVEPGGRADWPWEKLVMSHQPDQAPFIRVSGDCNSNQYWIPDPLGAMVGLEVGLMSALANLGHNRGKIFEKMARDVLRRWLPGNLGVVSGECFIRADRMQTDLAVTSPSSLRIIAEVKAYAPPHDPGESAFGHEYADACDQVDKRIIELRSGGHAWDDERGADIPASRPVEGMIVTLAGCGQALWDHLILETDDRCTRHAMIPLHHLTLAASLFHTEEDFLNYFALRRALIEAKVPFFDEHEPLFLGLSRRDAQEAFLMKAENASGQVIATGLMFEPAFRIQKSAPVRFSVEGRKAWARTFYRQSRQIVLPPFSAETDE